MIDINLRMLDLKSSHLSQLKITCKSFNSHSWYDLDKLRSVLPWVVNCSPLAAPAISNCALVQILGASVSKGEVHLI